MAALVIEAQTRGEVRADVDMMIAAQRIFALSFSGIVEWMQGFATIDEAREVFPASRWNSCSAVCEADGMARPHRPTNRTLAVALTLLPGFAVAADPCVSVTQKNITDGIELWADLTNCSEVTISITADETNVVNKLPATVDAVGRSHFVLAKWKRVDRDQAWRLKDWKYRWKLGRRLPRPPASLGTFSRPFEGDFTLIQGPHGTFSHFAGSQDEESWDWAMPEGTPVLAARDGVVVATRSDCSVGAIDEALKNEANYVIIRHGDGTFAEYHHLREGGVLVKLGARVTVGQRIGESGNTGYTSRPHLHFSVFHTVDGTLRTTLPVSFGEALNPVAEEAPSVKAPRRNSPGSRDRKTQRALKKAAEAFDGLDEQ